MNRENAHLYAPLVQALAAGQTIQANRGTVDEPCWEDLPESVLFTCDPHLYRVKPQPVVDAVMTWHADVSRCLEDVSTEMRARGRGDGRFQTLINRMPASSLRKALTTPAPSEETPA